MDPTACLDRAERAARENDFDVLLEALNDFSTWRLRGGATTDRDDARYEALSLNIFS